MRWAEERFAVIVSGVSGSEKFAESQKAWVSSLQSTLVKRLGFAADRVTVLSENESAGAAATRENVTRTLASLKPRLTADDTLLVVLIGHGTFDGTAAKFNLVGPDMDSKEWKAALDGNPARLVFVNTTSSSFQFVPALPARTASSLPRPILRRRNTRRCFRSTSSRRWIRLPRPTTTRMTGCRSGKRSPMPARR